MIFEHHSQNPPLLLNLLFSEHPWLFSKDSVRYIPKQASKVLQKQKY